MIYDNSLRQFRLFMTRIDKTMQIYRKFDEILLKLDQIQSRFTPVLVESSESRQPQVLLFDGRNLHDSRCLDLTKILDNCDER